MTHFSVCNQVSITAGNVHNMKPVQNAQVSYLYISRGYAPYTRNHAGTFRSKVTFSQHL